MNNKLKLIRNENKLTLTELSDILGIPVATLSRYENGGSEPKMFTWDLIADYFNVSVSYLMGLDEKLDKLNELEVLGEQLVDLANKIINRPFSEVYPELLSVSVIGNRLIDLSQEMRS